VLLDVLAEHRDQHRRYRHRGHRGHIRSVRCLIYAASISPGLAADVEAAMTDLEVAAVPTAEPPPGVHAVITASEAEPAAFTMVGDQITDIDAACQAGTHSIGYANKPGKAETLANAIITSLGPLALALRARPLPN
jgi:hypothetical protein